MDYNYIYFVDWLHHTLTCNLLLQNTEDAGIYKEKNFSEMYMW